VAVDAAPLTHGRSWNKETQPYGWFFYAPFALVYLPTHAVEMLWFHIDQNLVAFAFFAGFATIMI
jgi:hypothetical protein